MRIVRPQLVGLRCRVRLADGRVFTGALPPARHRAIQLGLLHAETAELVELTPGTRSLDGKSRSTADDGPSTTWPAEPPAGATGSRRCSRTPSRSSPAPMPPSERADLDASTTFYDTVLRTLGGRTGDRASRGRLGQVLGATACSP